MFRELHGCRVTRRNGRKPVVSPIVRIAALAKHSVDLCSIGIAIPRVGHLDHEGHEVARQGARRLASIDTLRSTIGHFA